MMGEFIDKQYKEYLDSTGLKEELMEDSERIERKMAFVAGLSQAFSFNLEICKLSKNAGEKALIGAMDDINNYWESYYGKN